MAPGRLWPCALSLMALGAVTASEVQIPLISQQSPLVADKTFAKSLVDTDKLQDSIKIDNLLDRANDLFEIAKLSEPEFGHPTRVIGSKGHAGTLDYVYSTLEGLGDYYTLSKQPFPAVMGKVYESRLVIGHDVPESASPMSLSPPTANKEPVYARLVLVANEGCDASDYSSDVAGNIAFVLRGTCPFGTKSQFAGKAGAVAAIVYNTDSGELSGTLGTPVPEHVATFGLSGKDASPIVKKLKEGGVVDSIAYIDSEVKQIQTTNIIAQTVEGDPDNCVMLGGHSDSVTEGPGINDDGSGSLTLLEVATQLTNFSVNNCVRFAWWAGEEEGLLGSDYYVDVLPLEENLKIRLFMDYDMMGSPNFAYQIYNATNAANPTGSEELRELYVDWYTQQGLKYTFIPFDGRSDYDAFIRNGIPGGGIATGAEGIKTEEEEVMFGGKAGDWYDPCYHQLCDDVGNVNSTAWLVNTKLIAHSVATFAVSFKDFPERSKTAALAASEQPRRYHGHHLVL
ncbi:Zn-dependent exopeptidase [Annulohypoxylon maeteangense]|uniref:Zn-dependent exopeptidase n=1 Tax=Annulohypoxylon maeteangense TaxID=1927788 RepID=UPI0020088A9D|nr:Zn-dependent exopeptidase [Annulohypoxylon maeteangense]KAI0882834.1 Zn-dependent exopeptidase [Annulohypoxylon maeteangense]